MLQPLSDGELRWLAAWLGRRREDAVTSDVIGDGRGMDEASTEVDVGVFGANITLDDLASIINETRLDDRWFGPALESSLVCAYALVIAVGLISNSLICFVVARTKSLRTARNAFVVNLAASDLVMCVFCMPLTLTKLILKDWPLGDWLCRLAPWTQAATVFASTMTITAIALDRYHVILASTSAASAPASTPTAGPGAGRSATVACLIASIWMAACLIALPPAVYSGTTEQRYFVLVSFTICMEKWPSGRSRFLYAAAVMLIQFVMPISILAAVHWRISNFLKKRIQANTDRLSSVRNTVKETKRHRKNTSLLMAITITFALCWFPLTLLNFLADFDYGLFMYRNFLLVYAFAHLVAMTSAIANPVLYGWYNTNFRRHFLRTVRFWAPFDDHEAAPRIAGDSDERCALNAIQAKQMSYKAIQTEVQPRLMTYTPQLSPVMMTEGCRETVASVVWYPGNETPDP